MQSLQRDIQLEKEQLEYAKSSRMQEIEREIQ